MPSISTFLGTTVGKVVLGTSVAAASVGGGQAVGAIDVPGLPDAGSQSVEIQTEAPDDLESQVSEDQDDVEVVDDDLDEGQVGDAVDGDVDEGQVGDVDDGDVDDVDEGQVGDDDQSDLDDADEASTDDGGDEGESTEG